MGARTLSGASAHAMRAARRLALGWPAALWVAASPRRTDRVPLMIHGGDQRVAQDADDINGADHRHA